MKASMSKLQKDIIALCEVPELNADECQFVLYGLYAKYRKIAYGRKRVTLEEKRKAKDNAK